jgi:hypothetical protein
MKNSSETIGIVNDNINIAVQLQHNDRLCVGMVGQSVLRCAVIIRCDLKLCPKDNKPAGSVILYFSMIKYFFCLKLHLTKNSVFLICNGQ